MAQVTKAYTFTNGQIADGTQVNKNFDDILTAVNGNIDANNIADGSVTAVKLATNAVETAKIKDANVTAAKMAIDSVATANIIDANVTAAKIADGVITLAKMATSFMGIEDIHYESSDAGVQYSSDPTTVITHTVVLSAARYCLIYAQSLLGPVSAGAFNAELRDGATALYAPVQNMHASESFGPVPYIYYGQLAQGSHDIALKLRMAGWASYNRLLIVQFSF